MKKLFYNTPTFTSSTWALLAVTRFFLAFIVLYGNSYSKNRLGFMKRRFLRIYPLYFISVLFAIILQFYLGSPYMLPNSTMVAAGNLTTVANFLLLQGIASITITYNGPLWSIGVEVFLYLMTPLLLFMRLRYLILIALISMFAFTFLHYNFLFGYSNIIWAWPFIIGLIISSKKQSLLAVFLLGLGILIVLLQKQVFRGVLSVLTVSLSIAICLIGMYVKLDLSTKTKKLFNYLGTISYPMYVFHLPLYLLLYHLEIRNEYAFVGLSILLCIPINYIFDIWLKNIFWMPLVSNFETKVKEYRMKSNLLKVLK